MQQLLFAPFNKKGLKKQTIVDGELKYEYEFPETREFRVENSIVKCFNNFC